MSKYHIALEPEKNYHLFNHAVGEEQLFRNDENFGFFLKKYVCTQKLFAILLVIL